MFLNLSANISMIHKYEDGGKLWFVGLDNNCAQINPHLLPEKCEPINEFLSNHCAFFREVKPFLSNYKNTEDCELIFEWRYSQKYGRNLTLCFIEIENKVEDVSHRCFRTHSGNYAKNSSGCWIWTDRFEAKSGDAMESFIAHNTKKSVDDFHSITKSFAAVKIRARIMHE